MKINRDELESELTYIIDSSDIFGDTIYQSY